MRGALVLLVLSTVVAGCNGPQTEIGLPFLSQCGEPTPQSFEPPNLDAITPGIWQVNATVDRMLVWVHNPTKARVNVTWNATGADGVPLPEGWQVTFEPRAAELQPSGTKVGRGPATRYPDWAWSLATLTVPPGTSGNGTLRLGAGEWTRELRMEVQPNAPRVSGPGDEVTVQYDGRFHRTGAPFDDGSFPTTLGSGRTVPGFDYGLMGLAKGECQRLVLPPALAYGYDNTDPRYARFNGEWLRFEVRIA